MPARDVLTVDGRGAPEDPPFAAAVRTLFATRAALGASADVPLEGSYSQDGDPSRFDLEAPSGWHWRLRLPAPPAVSAEAVAAAGARFGAPVHLRRPGAQRVARVLHHGPFADEGPSLAALYVRERGHEARGPVTETYLTDPSIAGPEELVTRLAVAVGE